MQTIFFLVFVRGIFLTVCFHFGAGRIWSIFLSLDAVQAKEPFFVLSTIVIDRAFDMVFAAALLVVIPLPYLIWDGLDQANMPQSH